MITLRTVIERDRVEYYVERADGLIWSRVERFGMDVAHKAGGYAFQAASVEQARQGALAIEDGERVEERIINNAMPRVCCDGNDPACPIHGVAASNARQNEFYRRNK